MVLSTLAGTAALAGMTLVAGSVSSGTLQATAEDGVYSAEQADRGQRTYVRECGTCHGVQLRGGETSIGLVGRDFMHFWAQESLGILYAIIQETMPEDDPGRLSPGETVDLIAMILRGNGFPPGDEELEADTDALFEILLTAAQEQR